MKWNLILLKYNWNIYFVTFYQNSCNYINLLTKWQMTNNHFSIFDYWWIIDIDWSRSLKMQMEGKSSDNLTWAVYVQQRRHGEFWRIHFLIFLFKQDKVFPSLIFCGTKSYIFALRFILDSVTNCEVCQTGLLRWLLLLNQENNHKFFHKFIFSRLAFKSHCFHGGA